MDSKEFKQNVELIQKEIKNALINGRFIVLGVFMDMGRDIYVLEIFDNHTVKVRVSSPNSVHFVDDLMGANLTCEEQKKVYNLIQDGGTKRILESKLQQLEFLNREVSNLKKILEG